MLTRRCLLGCVLLWAVRLAGAQYTNTTCEEFEKGAEFDPNQIVDSKWRIIYFYSDNVEVRQIIFSLIAKKRLDKFRAVVDAVYEEVGLEWNKATFMMEPKPGIQVLLLNMGTPGAFRGIVKVEQRDKARPNPMPLIKLADLRFKLQDRYLGMMCCEDMTAFVLARIDEVPSSEEECEEAALKMGFKRSGGKSHLYFKNLTRTEL